MNLKTAAKTTETQRHRVKTKRYRISVAHLAGDVCKTGNLLIYRFSLCLCASVVRNLR